MATVDERAAADRGGVVPVARFVRRDRAHHARGLDHPRVAGDLRTGVVTIERQTLVAQMIAVPGAGIGEVLAAFEQQYSSAGFGQPRGNDRAGRTRADDDAVIALSHLPLPLAGGPSGPSGNPWR